MSEEEKAIKNMENQILAGCFETEKQSVSR